MVSDGLACGTSLEAKPDTLVEAAVRGRAGLIKDKVSLRSHFGLQTEGNICVNLSTTGSPLWRGMQREIERRVGRERRGNMSVLFLKKGGMYLKLNLDSLCYQLKNTACLWRDRRVTQMLSSMGAHECASCRNAKPCNKSKLI